MNPWMLALLAWMPALLIPLWVAFQGRLMQRLVAVQLATNLTILLLVIAGFAFDESYLVDLPLTLAMLSLPSTVMFAVFIERWL